VLAPASELVGLEVDVDSASVLLFELFVVVTIAPLLKTKEECLMAPWIKDNRNLFLVLEENILPIMRFGKR